MTSRRVQTQLTEEQVFAIRDECSNLPGVVRLADAYLAQQRVIEAARDPFLVIVEHSPDAGMVANAEMKRAADTFRAAIFSAGSPETRETE